MKQHGEKKRDAADKKDIALEDVKKKLKKKELQTNILKKIIATQDATAPSKS